jgi:hypothetical protein
MNEQFFSLDVLSESPLILTDEPASKSARERDPDAPKTVRLASAILTAGAMALSFTILATATPAASNAIFRLPLISWQTGERQALERRGEIAFIDPTYFGSPEGQHVRVTAPIFGAAVTGAPSLFDDTEIE